MAPIHDRMPVILSEALWETWLDPRQHDLELLAALLVPASNRLLIANRVSTDVNKVSNNGPQLIATIDPSASGRPCVQSRPKEPAPQESLFD